MTTITIRNNPTSDNWLLVATAEVEGQTYTMNKSYAGPNSHYKWCDPTQEYQAVGTLLQEFGRYIRESVRQPNPAAKLCELHAGKLAGVLLPKLQYENDFCPWCRDIGCDGTTG